ncbi:fasciclin-like arabinogalactan protein 11 [Malania oleifera]|uniref:fasciclin-like arabinogalactan protein 11 n=1 Tax=Malania oleifera TaxID=397392 RepID=UPI0025AE5FAE|nr:fasciclin-like arabinogalactan protein 11 [Malania oleifera]
MENHIFSSFSLLLLILLHSIPTPSQSQPPSPAPLSPAPPSLAPLPPTPPSLSPLPLVSISPTPLSPSPLSPAPSAPAINITAILDKSGRFTSLIRLLKTTQVDDRISTLLSESKQGLTLLAPTDNAFSKLKSGTLNSLSVQQQVQVVLFHLLASYFPISDFQSASNPLRTLAGDNGNGDYPINVTTSSNLVKLTSGLVSTTIGKTIYTDGQLAVYEVDDVLLPPRIFANLPPAPAPTKRGKAAAATADDSSSGSSGDGGSVELSGAEAPVWRSWVWFGGAVAVAASSVF